MTNKIKHKAPTPRNPYSPRPDTRTKISSSSLTKQVFKKECDINYIVKQYQQAGVISHLNTQAPQYGFAPSEDFRASIQLVQDANELFASLPSELRSKFQGDPVKFLEFCEDPSNRSEMASLGLLSEDATSAIHDEQKAAKAASDALASQNEAQASNGATK